MGEGKRLACESGVSVFTTGRPADYIGRRISKHFEDGTFVAQVRDGAIRSASEVRVAVNNSEELKWWGTTSVKSAAADAGDDARRGGR